MAMITCSECGKEVSDKAASCVNCGAPIAQHPTVQWSPPPQRKKKLVRTILRTTLIVIAVFIGILIIVAIFSDPVNNDEVSHEMSATQNSSPSPSHSSAPAPTPSQEPATSSTPSPEPIKTSEEKFDDDVVLAIRGHLDNDDSNYYSLLGALSAYRLTAFLGLDDTATQNYRTMYYALHWRDAYIGEFGADSNMEEAERHIVALSSEEDVRAINEAFAEKARLEVRAIQDYKDSAVTVSYNDLIRNPSDHKGKVIKITVRIQQEMIGGLLRDSGYRGTSSGNEWYVSYKLPDGASRILVGDTVTFYGVFTGLQEVTRALTNTKEYVPRINAEYHS